jgi:hypothetical protein
MAFAVRCAARLLDCLRHEAAIPAHALPASKNALDTPLSPRDLSLKPGACYRALRRLPRPDSHRLA